VKRPGRSPEWFRKNVFEGRLVASVSVGVIIHLDLRFFGMDEISGPVSALRLFGAPVILDRSMRPDGLQVRSDCGVETWCDRHGWLSGDGPCEHPDCVVREVHEA
jgi:hypothetical protein